MTVLPRLAWMKIEMDLLAKTTLSSVAPRDQRTMTPYAGWVCRIENQRIIKHLPQALHRHLNGKILLNHWATTICFAPQTTQDIDWESAEKAMNQLPLVKRQWVSKLAAKFLPDGKNMKRWGLRRQSKCPRCSCQVEDKDHIFKCPAESAIGQWTKALEDLDQWLATTNTHPQLKKISSRASNNGMIRLQQCDQYP